MSGNRVWRLLAAFALVNVAEWSFVTALSIRAFDRAGTLGVALMGLRFLVGAVTSATVSPMLEARRGVITATALSRTLLLGIAAAALAVLGAPLGVLIGIVLVDAFVSSFYRPAQQRLIPSLVRQPHELMRAVAGCSTAKTVGQVAGGTLGGVALSVWTPAATLSTSAVLMMLATLCVWGPGATRPSPLIEGASSLLEGMRELGEVFEDRLIRPLVVAGMLRTLLRGVWASMLVLVALSLLHVGDSGVGTFQAAAGVGTVLAISVTATQVGRPRLAPLCALTFAASGLAICAVGLVPVYPVALVAICLWALAMAAADSTSMALLHRALDPRALFATVGAMDTLKLVTEGAGALLAPALVALLGIRWALLLVGLPMPILMIVSAGRLHATDRRASDRGRLVRLLHGVTLFSGLDLASIEDLASRLRPVATAPGEALVTQGAAGDRFYVIESGRASVLVDSYTIGHLGPGRWLGERALLRSSPRSATVRADEALLTQALDREDFLQAMTGLQLATETAPELVAAHDILRMPVEELLGMLTALSAADGPSIERLARHAHRVTFAPGATVFAEGDASDAMYVVLAGHAAATAADGSEATMLHPGDAFGEIGALHATARTRTVTAEDELTALVLPAEELLRAFGRAPGHEHPHREKLRLDHEVEAELS